MKKTILFLFFALLATSILNAQRITEKLDRGVLVVNKGGNQLLISWRYFATDPEDISFNIYRQIGIATPVKLNAEPITGATNYLWTVTGTALSVQSRFIVKPILNGVEGDEGGSWILPANKSAGAIVRDFNFEPSPAGYTKMTMKFCWPGDLDGDGQYDYVIDRHPGGVIETEEDNTSTTLPVFIDAYNSNGTFKWRVNAGVNVIIGSGQADMVSVYDLDGDNKAEVMMAVSEGTTFPDGTVIKNADGTVHDYNSVAGSAPQWIAVLNGETGNLIDTVSLSLFDEIKSDRTDKWKAISGQFIIQYLDGIHPSVVYQYKTRKATGHFVGGTETWRLIGGKLVKNWARRYHREDTEYESHQFRAVDADGDGKDELVQISYTIDDDGSLLNIIPNIAHGDRHCVTDIDPDRPGLEHFFIQQTNILGMGINDALTGEIIKANYLSAVADVGRGITGAFDPSLRGLQYFSTMASNAMYDSKGKLTDSKGSFPGEALWWGAGLSRNEADAVGSDKNPVIEAFDPGSKSMVRSKNLYKMDVSGAPKDYYVSAPNGGRGAFWGDLLGDWREELIYARRDTTGFVIMATDAYTTHRQYCLMQNPAYRIQTTHRGYYETADVDFYMANDMPLPPVAPIQTADVYLVSENSIQAPLHDGKSVMLDIRNPNGDITIANNTSLSRLWLMNPKGHNYTIGGAGKFTGNMDIVKSMQGDVILNGNHDFTGITRISEGRLLVNGTLAGKIRLDARGVIGGNATLNGGITLETGLNIEGGRIEPGNGTELGTLTISGNLNLPGRNNLAFDIDQTKPEFSDKLVIQGDFNVTNTNHSIVIKPHSPIQAGEMTLVTFTGTTNASKSNFKVHGLEGVVYSLNFELNAIKLIVSTPRQADVISWNGNVNSTWDYETKNFLKTSVEDIFVPNDSILFTDAATNKNIVINETLPVKGISFTNDTDYKISGEGIISGSGGLIKTGTGKLSLLTEENTFTGAVDFSDGILEVSSIKDGGLPSSIGKSEGTASNWIMRNATLQTASQMATTRHMTVVGKLTVNNPTSTNSIMIGGNIIGSNITLELTGAGALNLQGTNSFSKIIVKSGTLALGSVEANTTALGSASISLEGGTLQMRDANSTSTVGPFANAIDVPEGKTATWNVPMRWNFTNKLTGKGTININIPYVRSEFRGDWSGFEGTIGIAGGSGGGDFRINNDYGYSKATLNLMANANVFHLSTGKSIKLGGLKGTTGTLGGSSTTWVVGGNTMGSNTFGGIINGTNSALTKEGTGTLILSGANTYTGNTNVTNGTLIVTNTTGSATGTGNVSVSNATIAGTGTIEGTLVVGASGVIMPGVSATTVGTLKASKNVILTTTATAIMKISNSANDVLRVTGTLYLNGTLDLRKLVGNWEADKSYQLFNAAAISGNFTQILPETPGENLVWDLTQIDKGIIAVIANTALSKIDIPGVNLYPQPVTDVCFIDFESFGEVLRIELFDKTGKILLSEKPTSTTKHRFEIGNLESGLYFVRLIGNKNTCVVRKMIKK